jgi:hypothetical protein
MHKAKIGKALPAFPILLLYPDSFAMMTEFFQLLQKFTKKALKIFKFCITM